MSTRRAARAFEDFTGHKAKKVTRTRLDDRDVTGWKLGPAVGVAYEATRDGKTRRYFHEFTKKARPDLITRDDGRQLYFSGGRYQVTARGIEDMPSLFVVNPSPRSPVKKRKSRPMAAARRRTTRRRAPRQQVAVFRANPVRRKRRRLTARPARRRLFARNPARRVARRRRPATVRRFRRNPSARGAMGGAVNFGKLVMPAAGIGLGAVVSEIVMGYMPIPANLKTGVARHITKGAVGIAGGLVLGKLFKQKKLGYYFAAGAIAIAVHDAVKEMIASRMPAIPFGMYRGPIASSFGGMGFTNPGQTLRLGQYTAPIASSFEGNVGTTGGETDFAV